MPDTPKPVRRPGKSLDALLDWLGDGGQPVPAVRAELRARVCVNCPCNKLFSWKDLAKRGVASLIALQLRHRHQMQLKTLHDRKLGVCSACGCVLHLKVHVDSRYIIDNLTPEVEEKLDKRCWITKEKTDATP